MSAAGLGRRNGKTGADLAGYTSCGNARCGVSPINLDVGKMRVPSLLVTGGLGTIRDWVDIGLVGGQWPNHAPVRREVAYHR